MFAERAGCLGIWRKALEGWNMWQSQVIKEWKDAGRAEGHAEGGAEGTLRTLRRDVLKALRVRLQIEVPPDLAQAIERIADVEVLNRWFEAALNASTLEGFREVVGPG